MTTLERVEKILKMEKAEVTELQKRLLIEHHYCTVGGLKNLEHMLKSIDNTDQYEECRRKADIFKETMDVIKRELAATEMRLAELDD